MMTKQDRQKVLENIKDKDDKMLASKILDKSNKCDISGVMTYTNFLDLSQLNIIIPILNVLKISYKILELNENTEKKIIVFIPNNTEYNEENLKENIFSCIKIITKGLLKHKDYMGSIYSLGLKREFIGDIFVKSNFGYVICMKGSEEYILNNLFKVANQNVTLESMYILSEEVKRLDVEFKEAKIIVPSMRVDVVLSEIYNLSRSEIKDKISRGDLYINSRNTLYGSEVLNTNDIVSLKKYGKIKIGQVLRTTKNNKIEISLKKYS